MTDQSNFRLFMISAMYENGGNTTHRFLDGHPQMLVYPYESQLGTRFVDDALSSMFPKKYRWPAFMLSASPHETNVPQHVGFLRLTNQAKEEL